LHFFISARLPRLPIHDSISSLPACHSAYLPVCLPSILLSYPRLHPCLHSPFFTYHRSLLPLSVCCLLSLSLSLSLLPSFSPSAPPDKFPIPFLPVRLPFCPFSTCLLARLHSSPLCLQPTCLCSCILTCLLLFHLP
jgi:hypothetical protein